MSSSGQVLFEESRCFPAGYGPRSRLLALGLAIGNLPLLPFGTALGGYALWVLLHNEGRRVFEPHPPSPPSS